MSSQALISMSKAQADSSQVPEDFLHQISAWRLRGDNILFDFLFFQDHPARHIPWFIAFKHIGINSSEYGMKDNPWNTTLHYAKKIRGTILLVVLNESDDLTPPSVQYIGDWSRTHKSLDGVVVHFNSDGSCEQVELLGIFPDGLIGASADFSHSGGFVNRNTKIRAVFNVTMSYQDIGRTWRSSETYTTKKEPERKQDTFAGPTIDAEVEPTPFRKIDWNGDNV